MRKPPFELDGFGLTHHEIYEDSAAFVAALPKTYNSGEGRSWAGGLNFDGAKRACASGCPDAVAEAAALVEQVEHAGILTTGATEWISDVAGAYPCMPAYYAGAPDFMRWRNAEAASDRAPVRVFLDCCASAGITPAQLRTRGVAAMALTLALQARRPVELYVYASLGNYSNGAQIPCVRIDTQPLDIAAASYALAHASFLRMLCFAWGYDGRDFRGHWAWGHGPMEERHRAGIRKLFNVQPQDVVLYGPYATQADEIANPMKWLKDQLERHFNDVAE